MGRHTQYPYHLWTDGEPHILIRPDDFSLPIKNFRVVLHEWCRNNNYVARTRTIDPDHLCIRIFRELPTPSPVRLCDHCSGVFTRRSNGQKYCETCLPADNIAARLRMSNFRLSEPEYQSMLAHLPDGLCPICTTWNATAVDHDHSCCGLVAITGRTCGKCTRGILCIGCNIMIEKVESGKVVEIPAAAHTYLTRMHQSSFSSSYSAS